MTASSSFQCAGPAPWLADAFTAPAEPEPVVLKDGKRIPSRSPTNYNFVPTLPSLDDLESQPGSSCTTPTTPASALSATTATESPMPSIIVSPAPDIQQSNFVEVWSPALSALPVSPTVQYLGVPAWTMDECDDEDEAEEDSGSFYGTDDSGDWGFAYQDAKVDVSSIVLPTAEFAARPRSPRLVPLGGDDAYPRWL